MAESRVQISKGLEKSVTDASILLTDNNNEAFYLAPGSCGQVLSVIDGPGIGCNGSTPYTQIGWVDGTSLFQIPPLIDVLNVGNEAFQVPIIWENGQYSIQHSYGSSFYALSMDTNNNEPLLEMSLNTGASKLEIEAGSIKTIGNSLSIRTTTNHDLSLYHNNVEKVNLSTNGVAIHDGSNGGSPGSAGVAANSTLQTFGSFSLPIKTITNSYTANIYDHTIIVGAITSNITITLPAPSTCLGRIYVLRNSCIKAYNVATSTYFDACGYEVTALGYGATWVQSDGVNWQKIN